MQSDTGGNRGEVCQCVIRQVQVGEVCQIGQGGKAGDGIALKVQGGESLAAGQGRQV